MLIVSQRGLYENEAASYQTTWEALMSHLGICSKAQETDKNRIPLFNFTQFQGGIQKEHAQLIHAAMLDYDGTTYEQFTSIITNAQRFRGFGYTTYSHGLKADCRFRVALALDKPCPPQQWDTLWHRIGRMLGVVSPKAPDQKTRDPGRFFFIPAQNPAGPPTWFTHWDGPVLSLDMMLSPEMAGNEPLIIESELEQSERVSMHDLTFLAHTLAKKTQTDLSQIGRALLSCLRGEDFACEGYRNDISWKMAGEIAQKFPRASADDIAERFRAAFMLQDEPTVETFAGQLRRQQLKYQQRDAEKRALFQLRKEQALEQATTESDEPVAKGVVKDLPLMVQKDGYYWCREGQSGDYNEVYGARDIRLAIFRKYHSTIDLFNTEGQPYGLEHILLTYSHVVRKVTADYTAVENTYEVEQARLRLCTAPKRGLTPVYREDVDRWLRLLGGNCYEDIVAWIQGLSQLDRPSPALYLWGGSGVGKTLLAYGLAQIWEHPLTSFATVIESFNSSLARNPLVLADEGFPPETKFTWLRSFLSEGSRDINEKFRPHYTLHGHVRLYVTANNPAAFEFGRKYLTSQDATAIGERVIQIEAKDEARGYLEALGASGFDIQKDWVAGGGIAQHALWLATQPQVVPRGRWAVQPKHADKTSFESKLVETRYAWFVAWLSDYLNTPRKVEGRFVTGNPDGWQLRTESCRLLIALDAYRYVSEGHHKCEPSEFKHALAFFARPERVKLRMPGNPSRVITYRQIDVDRFYACAKDYVDQEALVSTIQVDTKTRVEQVTR